MLDSHIKSDVRYKKDPFMVVSVNDSAIDTEKSNLTEYKKTRDMKHLVLNGPATVFHLRLLPSSVFSGLLDAGARSSKVNVPSTGWIYKTFLTSCLTKVENVMALDENGNAREVATVEPPRVNAGERLSLVEDKFFDEYFPNCAQTLEEIGRVAFERHFLAEGIWKQFGA